jgi:hypothetical protein
LKNIFLTVLDCCLEFQKNLGFGLTGFEIIMQKLQKRIKERRKKRKGTGPR